MGLWSRYKLRVERKRRELKLVVDRTSDIKSTDILVFSTIRNENTRLPYFLEYYRKLGTNHFFFVDNDSSDGSLEYLSNQLDVSLWTTKHSYKRSKFGTLLLDLYPKGKIHNARYMIGQDPVEAAPYFDASNYFIERNKKYGNLWIQGGPRMRAFFRERPQFSPALNKTPLVKWSSGNVYVSSTHTLLPRGLNLVYDEWGGEKACGCLLHTKFLETFAEKANEEIKRKQHYAASREYRTYVNKLESDLDLWTPQSTKYRHWQQLEKLGLMSRGNWA